MQSLKSWRLICSESASEYDYFAAQEVMKVNLSQSSGCSIVYFGFPAERLRNRKNEDIVAVTLSCDVARPWHCCVPREHKNCF